jgi:multimeric flavodoxin WrbA
VKQLLIVYHSQSGATQQLAWAAFAGARREQGVHVRILRAAEAGAADLRDCDAVLLAGSENFGYLSGGMKDFLDRSFYPVQGDCAGLPCALLISAGNDGSGALRQFERILRGYPMRQVAEATIVHGVPDKEALGTATDLGEALAAGLALGIY